MDIEISFGDDVVKTTTEELEKVAEEIKKNGKSNSKEPNDGT